MIVGEDLYCIGQKVLTEEGMDNFERVFVGYPDMNDEVRKMLLEYAEGGEVTRIMIFFIEACGFGEDYAGFLMREVLRGNIK